jgi:uncharacterized metal-binding protein
LWQSSVRALRSTNVPKSTGQFLVLAKININHFVMSSISELYNADDIQMMWAAEEARTAGANRVEELRKYIRNAGITRIGVGHCAMFTKEAQQLKSMLEKDVEVVTIDCKCGKINTSELLNGDYKGISCNPSGQAAFLKAHETQLNVALGLCIGHDIVFNQKSAAPVTTLLIKDRQHGHNPYKIFC